MATQQTGLSTKHPRLIQRCSIDREDNSLDYDYMGSAEFEVGGQANALRKMFEGEITDNPARYTPSTGTSHSILLVWETSVSTLIPK